MDGMYPVYLDGRPVGQATVRREGLYAHIFCQCEMQTDAIYKVQLTCQNRTQMLGTLCPDGQGMSLKKRIPAKALCAWDMVFQAVGAGQTEGSLFVPIHTDRPFPALEHLAQARLARQNGQIGVLIQK